MHTYQDGGLRQAISIALAVATAALPLLGRITVAHATQPQLYIPSDLIGQIDGSGNPVWTQKTLAAGTAGLRYPNGTAVDDVHHRLFVADCTNNRVLVYNLGTDNVLTDRIADFVLGQANFTTTGSDDGDGNVNPQTMSCPDGPSYDPLHDRLFIADDNDNRILEFDLSGGITNGMAASHVLGQPDFSAVASGVGALDNPYGGTVYDATTQRLYVSDSGNARVLVYAAGNTVTNNQSPAFVIGQPSFTARTHAVTQSGFSDPYGLALDSANHRLFVADDGSNSEGARVLVFDTNALANGMNAMHILGAATYVTTGIHSGGMSAVGDPEMLAYDPAHQRLFVSDDANNRITVFDVSTITDNQNAVAVIGQPDFTTTVGNYNCNSLTPQRGTLCDPEGLSDAFDQSTGKLYVSDSSFNRVLIYDFVTMAAASLPNPTAGTPYASAAIQTQHAQGTVSFAVTSGSLPAGLSLNPATGAITGTATVAGNYAFTLTAADTLGSAGHFTDSKSYVLAVSAAAISNVPNGGDANGDGIADTAQASVGGAISPVTGKYVAVAASGACSLSSVTAKEASDNAVQDSGYAYPAGFTNYVANCGTAGYTATVKLYAYGVTAGNLVLRKYNPVTHGYSNITGASIVLTQIGGQSVTVATYQITDGGPLDTDGIANGVIVDPVGLGQLSVNVPNTGTL